MVRRLRERENTFFSIIAAPLRSQYPGCGNSRQGTALDTAELDALCLERIARCKRPRGYRLVESLPKNNYGKVLKTEPRKRLAARGTEQS